jgi:isoleucyl-tRNA synthetase
MSNRYHEFASLDLPAAEVEVLNRWTINQTFEKSVSIREGATPFVFYEGPPSANGMPGIHHVISRTLKDLVCRYKTMKGYQVKRKGGWDTHGLPIELGVEKELGITKEDIGVKISIEDYNQKCREAVLRYKDKWDEITRKMGYWVDLNDPYITFTNEYIETLWWILGQLYKRDLLYQSVSIQPYSPAAGTGLSSHELNQPGTYQNVKDTSVVAMFRLVQNEASKGLHDIIHGSELFMLAWTTTPWTLPSNLGLTVGANIDYALVHTFNPYTHLPVYVVLAKELLHKYFKPEGENGDMDQYKPEDKIIPWKMITVFKGKTLEHLEYEQLMPYEANAVSEIEKYSPGAKPFRVLLGDFVTTEDGTGIVHTAPAFGADDFKVGKKYNIGILTMVDRQGKFVENLGELSGRYVKNYTSDKNYVDVNVDISVKLKKENRAFKVEKYEHSYPHCWRTDKPILYYPLDAWFIKTTALKDQMVSLNKTINWKPKSTGEGRFGNWLENMVDWNLSRSRFWGTPLPIWTTADGKEQLCISTIEQLNDEMVKAAEILGGDTNQHYLHNGILDLHKPYVDEITLVSPSGQPMKRVPDLIDVWFDSGAMPYAQWGLDHEKVKAGHPAPFKDGWEKAFPADFIAEGVDQTRGWFYTLHALAALLFNSTAYRNVVSNGLVLDSKGSKMSKRIGNVVDPFKTIETYGADATRWYLITNASPWDNLRFDVEGIKEVQRKIFGTLHNIYQFFALYANVDGFSFTESTIPVEERPEMDRWILSELHTLISKVTNYFDDYDATLAGRVIEEFVGEQFSNWYIRLCRRRFWKGEYEKDKISAYQTLYECLETVVSLMAPISPFYTDSIFCKLNQVTGKHQQNSVHHIDFPVSNSFYIDSDLEARMDLAQKACSLILSLRKKQQIKVRQPLQKVLIPVLSPGMRQQLESIEVLLKAEVNVKEVVYLNPEDSFIRKKVKPNFVALGKRMGPKMKPLSLALAQLSQEQIQELESSGSIYISNQDILESIQLSEVDILAEDIPGWSVASGNGLTVAIDITITPALQMEGNAREFVNRIQNIRKDSGLDVTDRITVSIVDKGSLKESIITFMNYICTEILADSIDWLESIENGTDIEINENQLIVRILKTK